MSTPASTTKSITKVHARRPTPTLPTSNRMRPGLVEAAGYTHAKQIELIKRVIESCVDALTANKETPGFSYGKLVDVHSQPDHTARAKAREQLIHLFGAANDNEGKVAPVKVEIPLPPWAAGIGIVPTPARPQSVEVIDADSTTVEPNSLESHQSHENLTVMPSNSM